MGNPLPSELHEALIIFRASELILNRNRPNVLIRESTVSTTNKCFIRSLISSRCGEDII
jgi:hypothetical protein